MTAENIEIQSLITEMTLGQQFRQARLEKGLSLEEASQKTRLRPNVLVHLEQDEWDFDNIPTSFVRGYIRSYAKFLGLAEKNYQMVIHQLKDNHPTIKMGENACVLESERHYGRWIGWVSIVVILVVLAMTAFWWWESFQHQSEERENLVSQYEQTQQIQQNENSLFSPETTAEQAVLEIKNTPVFDAALPAN